MFYTSTSGTNSVCANDGFRYRTAEGTTSSNGTAQLCLGNNIASGTAGNKKGTIRLYGTGSNYGTITTDTITSSRSWTFPDKGGTVAMVDDIPTSTSGLTNDSGYVTSDTKNTAGSTEKADTKLYLIGAKSQATYA